MRQILLSDRLKSDVPLVFLFVSSAFCFNVDLSIPVIHRGIDGTMFGFSVAQYKENGQSWLIVGAPKAQTNQPGVERGGAVYKCYPEHRNRCQQIPFDETGSETVSIRGIHHLTENKTDQWFGATVQSSGENGVVVACAPRYVYYGSNLGKREPVGVCWVSSNEFRSSKKYSPCKNPTFWGPHKLGFCQAGFSAAISKDGKWLYIGAVGSWYWQGQVFSQHLQSDDIQYQTKESPKTYDDSYLGYSAAVGEFTGDDDMDVVVGMPKANITGRVVLFNSKLENLLNITGEQIGAYFGYCICVADVNGDKLDDIIIGAPLFSDFNTKGDQYEEGRVYVIYQTSKTGFHKMVHLDGTDPKGRFGLALTSLGDINRDGYQDFAVGAPYGGIEGKGAVYIYHGSSKGVREKSSQIITANDFTQEMSTFGFSLSGGLDLDNNHYPDLLVGAYNSDLAIYLRSRPVANVIATLEIKIKSINLEETNCKIKDKADSSIFTEVSCFGVAFCLEYTGIGVASELDFIYQIKLDSTKTIHRAYFLNDTSKHTKNFSLTLKKDSNICSELYAYMQNDIRDKLTAVTVSLEYFLIDSNKFLSVLKPITNKHVPNEIVKQVTIQNNCEDSICIPDLQLDVIKNMEKYIVGSKDILQLDVRISNAGEDAFEAMLYLIMPLNVNYININKTMTDLPISCDGAQPETGVNELVCDIGNPFPAKKSLRFIVLLQPSQHVKDLKFQIAVNSTNSELSEFMFDNYQEVTVPVDVKIDMILRGISEPDFISYNKSDPVPEEKLIEEDIGPLINHIYQLRNKGPSVVKKISVEILWPSYNLNKEPLLYLMEQPEVKGKKAKCKKVKDDVNPLHVKYQLQTTPKTSVNINDLKKKSLDSEESPLSSIEKRSTKIRKQPFLTKELECGPTICTRIKCTVENLLKGEEVIFRMQSRLWRESVNKLNLKEVKISSKLVAIVTELPDIAEYSEYPYKITSVSTIINLEDVSVKKSELKWWMILLAVLGGLILLIILAVVLWWLGFFKRKRPQEEPEKQPLQNNGYQMARGDEAL